MIRKARSKDFEQGPRLTTKTDKQPRIIQLSGPINADSMASFFAIANPGMEGVIRREIEEILHGQDLKMAIGGIQFNSQIRTVLKGQPKLKTVNRLLLRVDQFGVRDFQKLFRKVKGLPWQQWLKPQVGLKVRASSHRSRLKIKKGIERTVLEAFQESIRQPKAIESQFDLLTIVRIEDDICTMSVDLSGDLLHKRGDRQDVGEAPLRETWAAAVLDHAWSIIEAHQNLREAFEQKWHWIEPMAGTGVFIREALKEVSADRIQLSNSRKFAMDECLIIHGLDLGELSPEPAEKILKWSPLKKLSKVSVFDRDAAQVLKAKAGIESLEKDKKTEISFEFRTADGLNSALQLQEKTPRFVVVNPPWGVRLKSEEAVATRANQERLLQKIAAQLGPAFVAVLLPDTGSSQNQARGEANGARPLAQALKPQALKLPNGWTEHEGFSFRAGGIPISARFFSVR